jgi:hypothetical protein
MFSEIPGHSRLGSYQMHFGSARALVAHANRAMLIVAVMTLTAGAILTITCRYSLAETVAKPGSTRNRLSQDPGESRGNTGADRITVRPT